MSGQDLRVGLPQYLTACPTKHKHEAEHNVLFDDRFAGKTVTVLAELKNQRTGCTMLNLVEDDEFYWCAGAFVKLDPPQEETKSEQFEPELLPA